MPISTATKTRKTASSASSKKQAFKGERIKTSKGRRRPLTAAQVCDDEDGAFSNAVSLAAARDSVDFPLIATGDADADLSNAVSVAAARASLQ